MEQTPQKQAKESIVSRLFHFGRKRADGEAEAAATSSDAATGDGNGSTSESGFARTEAADGIDGREEEVEEEPRITVPEQVIRVRAGRMRGKDEAISAISDGFRELNSLLGKVSDRLDRSSEVSEQFKELPDFLRALPQLHREQNEQLSSISERIAEHNDIAHRTAENLAKLPALQEEQVRAVETLSEKVSYGADAVVRMADEMRDRAASQEAAIRKVAAAQQQTAKVLHIGHQKSLQLFHQATQKTLQTVQQTQRDQNAQMRQVLDASITNMKRMFWLAGAFVGAGIVALAALLFLH